MTLTEGMRSEGARGTVSSVRAREPDRSGYAVRSGVRLHYEVFGDGPVTVVLLPAWSIVHSRLWKLQVPFLARHFRVVTYDPRGNGRSDRPAGSAAYGDDELVADAVAVIDEVGVESAVVVGLSAGGRVLLGLAADHPDRVAGAVFVAPAVTLEDRPPSDAFDRVLDRYEGWNRWNANYWRQDYPGYASFYFDAVFPEPHSTRQHEEAVSWALETDAETLVATRATDRPGWSAGETRDRAARVRCPSIVVHGTRDHIVPLDQGRTLAQLLDCPLEVAVGAGHCPQARQPVWFNDLVRRFAERVAVPVSPNPSSATSPWVFTHDRGRKALWVCSPIGLGHVLRDLAVARALRAEVPDLEIEWLAQDPVTRVLEAEGERVHPASGELASESAHWESEAVHHDLHAFHAFRRMDEILAANYMLFDDVVRETSYDLWVGDESWEVDHFLHENPERKIAPYAFLTDVVGFLPVDPEADPTEADLAADYNAEMIEHRARFPRVRDRSLFIGGFDELPDASFGAGLPRIRDWSRQWFESVPYVVPFDPAPYRRTASMRRRLGYGTGYPLYVAAVGGTAVGRDLLELTAEAFAVVRKEQPEARMVMVTGPRIDPAALPEVEGMDTVGFVPNLFEHLACADVAVVQGGLSTTMELVAARRPFIYFPLAHHWEQQHFVAHRLDHYRAGVRMDYAATTPPVLAAAMVEARSKPPAYRPVRRGGETRAAARLASLLVNPRG